jgi:hypothetical protein
MMQMPMFENSTQSTTPSLLFDSLLSGTVVEPRERDISIEANGSVHMASCPGITRDMNATLLSREPLSAETLVAKSPLHIAIARLRLAEDVGEKGAAS